jgi:hypothetical protein
MRTTVTLDDDVAAAVDAERAATGESFRDALNRLVRRGLVARPNASAPPLPLLPGRPAIDISDVSVVIGELDDERALDRRS